MEGESLSSSFSPSSSIFILCGAARRGMLSDPKMGNREWTLVNANEGTERGRPRPPTAVLAGQKRTRAEEALHAPITKPLPTLDLPCQPTDSPRQRA
jgi:hypothetical protein